MLDRPDTTRRDTLRRYHSALDGERTIGGLNLVTTRFTTNHRIGPDHPLSAELRKLLDAHMARVGGMSSPAECDRIAKEIADA